MPPHPTVLMVLLLLLSPLLPLMSPAIFPVYPRVSASGRIVRPPGCGCFSPPMFHQDQFYWIKDDFPLPTR